MAQRTILICDKCEKELPDVTTWPVTIDGKTLEVDLCGKDAKPLEELVALGREVVVAPVKAPAGKKTTSTTPAVDLKAVRAWAKSNPDKAVYKGESWYADLGRVPDDIITAFHAADN